MPSRCTRKCHRITCILSSINMHQQAHDLTLKSCCLMMHNTKHVMELDVRELWMHCILISCQHALPSNVHLHLQHDMHGTMHHQADTCMQSGE